jgi:hypothetical protein
MASMPGRVTRTITFKAMDEQWSGAQEAFLTAYDTSSEQLDKLLDDAVTAGVIRAEVAEHVKKHWLGAYWPNADARAVLQRGLYWGMRVSLYEDGELKLRRKTALPVSCVWICSSGGYSSYEKKRPYFDVTVVESAYQVTLLFITPDPHGDEVPDPGCFQPVWSTRHEDFQPVPGELQIGQPWEHTITVRPYDYKPV